MARPLVALLVALLPASALAADTAGRLRISTGAGWDTNAKRDQDSLGHVQDAFFSVVGAVEARATFASAQLFGSYDLGGRKFLFYPSEDVLIQAADAEGSIAVGRFLGVGVRGHARDRRGQNDPRDPNQPRNYTDLDGAAFLQFVPDATLDLEVYAAAHRFIYWPTFAYSFAAPEIGASARYRFDSRHQVVVFGEVGMRRYNGLASLDPAIDDPPPPRQREDTAFLVGAGYVLRGPIPLTLNYSYFDQSSNSFGETLHRHRINATAAFRLPARFFLFANAQIQLSSYPQGFRLSTELVLDEDSENHNSFSLKLVRPISDSVDLEARFGWFQNVLPHFGYHRQLYWVGMTWRR
ncbi:MAG: hypothetical protein IRZ16_14320 [Myxococcaceae bacterium]|nr:hypothetical protein [Myxococcaceae bacterium]